MRKRLLELIIDLFSKDSIICLQKIEKININDLRYLRLLFSYLTNENMVIPLREDDTYELIANIKEILELLKNKTNNKTTNLIEKPLEPSLYNYEEQSKPTVVYSVPLSLSKEMDKIVKKYPNLNVLKISASFKKILSETHKELLLILPFLELDGISFLATEIEALGKEKVNLRLITRGIIIKENKWGYEKKIKGLKKFYDLYCLYGKSEDIQIKDFTSRIVLSSSVHYEGIHQKIIISDNKVVYQGSGEIRGGTLFDNGDSGILLYGEFVKFFTDFFYLFWNNPIAQLVDETFFKDFLK